MADMTITLSIQPGAGLSSTGLNSPLSGSNSGGAPRSAQQDNQLMEALDTLLSALLPNSQGNTPSSTDGSPLGQAGAGNGGSSALGQNGSPADMLMKLLETLIQGKNGQEAGNPFASGSSGATGGNSGTSPLTGSSGTGDAGSAQNPEDLSRSLLQDSAGSALDNAISPTADGGGQLSTNDLLKALLELIGNLMDSQKGEFGQPQGSGQSQGSGSPSVGVPQASSGGNGGSPTAPSAPSGGASPAAPSAPVGGSGGVSPGASPAASTAGAGPVSFPTASGNATVVNDTIKVGPGEVFDGGGKTFTAGSKLGDGGQAEGQKPLFELAPGATLKNVVFGDNAADGVHVRGDAKIDNVHWTNVGEDALTVKSNGGKPANVEITNSSAQGASDKIFQLNADANLTIDNFKAKDFGTFVRTNGGQQGNWNLNLSNIDAENGKFSFVKSDSEGLNVKGSNINLTNVNNHYKVPDSANLQVN
ncbi:MULTISPECIES: pectate lyase [Brenneria]|uniref:pectate lyase n=1 Tax=Brenneria nigrifluens DSM 30175 = ATCC 13028 TaxID=1121120 RepID=A0A2U1UIB9_9GAMM|nr:MULTISPECIES: pectate lyase [Brenneria]EHD21270.1 Pectate lyase [Brenneria sp. EniD312]PWC21410.1 pectate lyase [Brenneria nigrifluens] [Brenneria nigrifluens DSM 30175 = ATCC 13028]QCR04409.1 pectate lyase [Brenneria nigrifluens] [Brenneria nigrifluens DSM 30175 = ATCC 13028]